MSQPKQPAVLAPTKARAFASTLADGVMGFGHAPDKQVANNRASWLKTIGLSAAASTLVRVTYEAEVDYRRIATVTADDKGRGMATTDNVVVADALFTREKRHGLFLPLADCAGIVLHDPRHGVLGLAHLGRQATFADLAGRLVTYMEQHFASQPADIRVWISPSISGDSYLLHTFDLADQPAWQPHARRAHDGWLVDLQSYNIAQLKAAGVPAAQIEHAGIDTATHPDYPSHHRYRLHGEAHKAGRFAVACYLVD